MTTRFREARPPRTRRLSDRGPFAVHLVDGERIRNRIEVDFTMDGTNARWKFIPDGEIWIDACLSDFDRRATILHETREYALMKGAGQSYDVAHEGANVVERAFRKRCG